MCHCDDRPLNNQLISLIKEAHCAAPKSYQRRRALNRLVILMQTSGRLWKGGGTIAPDDLAEAKSHTWLFICKHLGDYAPNQGTVINWYNQILQQLIRDLRKERDRGDS